MGSLVLGNVLLTLKELAAFLAVVLVGRHTGSF
jgi:hypothetical protein